MLMVFTCVTNRRTVNLFTHIQMKSGVVHKDAMCFQNDGVVDVLERGFNWQHN